MATKKEIIASVKSLIECYYQEGEITIIPVYSIEGSTERLPEKEIIRRWSKLLSAIASNPRTVDKGEKPC